MRALTAVLLLFASVPAAPAQEAPPSDASLHELIEISGAAKMLDELRPQLEAMLEQAFQQALEGKALGAEQERILRDMRAELTALVLEDLSWARYEPMIIEIYRKSFSQAEIDGMVAFYRTDTGRAVLAKMPVVMQHTMTLMKDNMAQLMPRLEAIQRRALERLKALEAADG